MFGKKKQNEKKESLNFKSDNYKLNDNYSTNNLVVANFSIPFCNKNNFKELWNKIKNGILKGGYFVGNFLEIMMNGRVQKKK